MSKLYTFGCTFNVVKDDKFKMTDMELESAVLYSMKQRLSAGHTPMFYFVEESIHPIMVGPEGGVDIEE